MRERYDNLDGLRIISCLALIAMHIQANAGYTIPSFVRSFMISWTHLVLLFLMISGFGMFCGYYERFKNGSISLNSFYAKRYKKTLPFFLTLIVIDIVLTRNTNHIIEGITEATLIFGLLPNNQPEVIGVSWTLGVIFLFYILFPFFVFLFWSRRRAWISFIMSIVVAVFCCIYYYTDRFVVEGFTARHNFLYCAPFFAAGALIYIYRDAIKTKVSKYRYVFLAICLFVSVICLMLPNEGKLIDLFVLIRCLVLFVIWIIYAISVEIKILNNRISKYLSGISFEMYLAHMFVFRITEKANVIYLVGHGLFGLVFTFAIVILGLLLFIRIWWIAYKLLSPQINKIVSTNH